MTIAEIYQESDTFFEFPTPNHSHVTTTSAILFAQHIAKQAHREGWEQAKFEAMTKSTGRSYQAIASMTYKEAESGKPD